MILIEILTEPRIQANYGRALGRGALGAFVEEAAAAIGLRGGVSVLLTGDGEIRRLNRAFRKKDHATDVLSFPAPAESGTAGDLAISVETAARQAEEQGHALRAELRILALHGLLHLAGFDHETDAGAMARKEGALRRRFGLEAGLIERSGPKPISQRLKPQLRRQPDGTAAAVPFQDKSGNGRRNRSSGRRGNPSGRERGGRR